MATNYDTKIARRTLTALLLLISTSASSPALGGENKKELPQDVVKKIEKGDIVIKRKDTDRCFGVYAYALIDSELKYVWQAALDYDNFKDFMPNTLKSKAVWKDDTPYYHGVIKFLFITQNYVVKHKLEDEPDRKVDHWELVEDAESVFEDESTFDFSTSEGRWILERYGDGKTFSDYYACINFTSNIPKFIQNKASNILLKISVPDIIKATAKRSKEFEDKEKK